MFNLYDGQWIVFCPGLPLLLHTCDTLLATVWPTLLLNFILLQTLVASLPSLVLHIQIMLGMCGIVC
jgi:hypothetical protein